MISVLPLMRLYDTQLTHQISKINILVLHTLNVRDMLHFLIELAMSFVVDDVIVVVAYLNKIQS